MIQTDASKKGLSIEVGESSQGGGGPTFSRVEGEAGEGKAPFARSDRLIVCANFCLRLCLLMLGLEWGGRCYLLVRSKSPPRFSMGRKTRVYIAQESALWAGPESREGGRYLFGWTDVCDWIVGGRWVLLGVVGGLVCIDTQRESHMGAHPHTHPHTRTRARARKHARQEAKASTPQQRERSHR